MNAHACCKYQLGPTTPTTIPLTRVDQEREEEEERRQRERAAQEEREGKKEEVATKESEEGEGRKQLGDIGALRQDFTAMPQ